MNDVKREIAEGIFSPVKKIWKKLYDKIVTKMSVGSLI